MKKINRSIGNDKERYDCAIGVSGAKDSIMTLYIAKKELKLNPLAIFETEVSTLVRKNELTRERALEILKLLLLLK